MRWHVRRPRQVLPLVLGGILGLASTLFSPLVRAQGAVPGVFLTTPSTGATVWGTTTVSAAATDAGATGLQFQVNGVNLGPQITSGSCSTTWDTTAGSDGNYTLVAIASDSAGGTVTSPVVTVTVENAVPSISAVAVSSITAAAAIVTWTTSQASGTQVDYGTTTTYGTSTTFDSTWETLHSQMLTGLGAGTTYHFHVRSWNAHGLSSTSGDFVFATTGTTAPPPAVGCSTPDPYAGGTCVNGSWSAPSPPAVTAPPRISGVAVMSVTNSGAALTWTTNQAADSEVDYGRTAGYGTSTPVNPTLVTTHREALTGLAAGTSYHFRVGSWNARGVAAESGDFVLTTLSNPRPPKPPKSGGNGCTTPDPFVVLGGGTCWQGGWRPPVVTSSGGCATAAPSLISRGGDCVAGSPSSLNVLTPPSTSPVAGSTGCITPDPFVVLGGGICAKGGWRPPAYAIALAPAGGSGTCTTPDPFVALGGGSCVNGGWRPATIVLVTGAGTSVPVVNPALCKTPDPFAGISGLVGACINGGWVPVVKAGG